MAIGHVSNVTGCIAPVEEVVRVAHARGIPVLLDAAQSLSHLPIDVRTLDVDFLAASSHKAFGPSGIGFLFGKRKRLREFPLYQVGGGMVAMNEDIVGTAPSHFLPRDVPFRFEAGTPAIESTIGFGAAIRWMRAIGMDTIRRHDAVLTRYLVSRLRELPSVRVLAADVPPERRIALATFVVDAPGMTQENVARALCDMFGVCVSGGFHCTHVLHAPRAPRRNRAREPSRIQHLRRNRPSRRRSARDSVVVRSSSALLCGSNDTGPFHMRLVLGVAALVGVVGLTACGDSTLPPVVPPPPSAAPPTLPPPPATADSAAMAPAAQVVDAGPAPAPVEVLVRNLHGPAALAVDKMVLYWINEPDGEVNRAPKRGGFTMTLFGGTAGAFAPGTSMAIDDANVFWTQQTDDGKPVKTSTLQRQDKNGGKSSALTTSTIAPFTCVTVDDASVYWVVGNGVMRAAKSGGSPVVIAGGQTGANCVAVDDKAAYWSMGGTEAKQFGGRRHHDSAQEGRTGEDGRQRGGACRHLAGGRQEHLLAGRGQGDEGSQDGWRANATGTSADGAAHRSDA